jgi:hypothetical protein
MWKNIIAKILDALKAKGSLTPEDEKKLSESLHSIELDIDETRKPEKSNTTSPEIQVLVDQVKELGAQNKALMDAFAGEKRAREESTAQLQKSAEEARAKQIKALVDEAVGKGKFTPKDAEKWTARLTKDFDGTQEIIKEIPDNPALAKGKENDADKKSGSNVTPDGKVNFDTQALMEAAAAEFRSNAK